MKNHNRAPEKQKGGAAETRFPMTRFLSATVLMVFMLFPGLPACYAETDPAPEPAAIPSPLIRIDPFVPFIEPPKDDRPDARVAEAGTAPARETAFRTPLQLLTMQEITLVGIVIGGERKLAVVRDGRGIVHDLYEGMAVGMSDGRVLEILQDRVIIEETLQDPSGRKQSHRTVLRIE